MPSSLWNIQWFVNDRLVGKTAALELRNFYQGANSEILIRAVATLPNQGKLERTIRIQTQQSKKEGGEEKEGEW